MKINKSKMKKNQLMFIIMIPVLYAKRDKIYKLRSKGIEYNDSSSLEDKYNRRMYAYQNGIEYVGAAAFILIWKNTQGFKWLTFFLDNKFCIFFNEYYL